MFKHSSVTHFLIPLSISWIPNKIHPKEKNYQENMHAILTKSKQLPRIHLHFISNSTLFRSKKTLYCFLFVYTYFHRTMEEFTLKRPYFMKKCKEPSEKQNLKKHYNILYAIFTSRCCFVKKKHNYLSLRSTVLNTITFFCKL